MNPVVAICFSVTLLFMAGCSKPLKVHMLSGSNEYRSNESLTKWAERLEGRYRVECSLTLSGDKAKSVDGLGALEEADVLVVFCRRWELEGVQEQVIVDWVESGKPIIGIRTASHAFEFYKEFDSEILGGDYSGHGPAEDEVRIQIMDGMSKDPLLEGVRSWARPGKVYRNPEIAVDCEVLLEAESLLERQPVAWRRQFGQQRVFYTSLGLPEDFQSEQFLSVLERALLWVSGVAY